MRIRIIAILLLSMLRLGWGESCAYADCEDLRRQLPEEHDIKRLKALEAIYTCSMDSDDFSYQLRCVNDLIAEARLQEDKQALADALAERSVLFYNNAMDDSVITTVKHDLATVKETEVWQVYYEMWSHVANSYLFMKQNNLGLRETKLMFDDARQRNNQLGMGLAYCIMGTAYANMRNFDQSVTSYQRSLDILTAISPLPPILPDVFTYYGNALNDMGDYEQLERLTEQWKVALDKYIIQHKLQNHPTAAMYKAFYLFACVQTELGLGKLDEAERNLKEARAYFTSADTYQTMKWLYYSAQLQLLKGNTSGALSLSNQRLRLLDGGSDEQVKIRVLKQRAEIMQRLGRFEEAARLYHRIYVINDSANTQGTKSQLTELNTMFQVSELEMEQERMQMDQERDRFRFIIIVVTLLVLSLVIFLFIRIRAARRLKLAHTQLQTAYGDLQAANEVIAETTAAKERIESELRIARDIQMSMVPNIFPEYPGLDIYASMTPAKEVGGDLYNTLLEDDQLYFCVGDVSGKGVPASLFMAQATRLFRTLAKQRLQPGEIGTRLNEELAEDNEQGMFVTMFIGLIDLKTGHLAFCNAGHNPPVLNGAFMTMEPNAPIGLWPGLEYVGEEVENIFNQPLFIYTDGLNEAENMEQEQFGDDHLLQLADVAAFDGAQRLIETMVSEVEKHRDGADPNDDLTMMCIMAKQNT